MYGQNEAKISDLIGKTFTKVSVGTCRDTMSFTNNEIQFVFEHFQDCCECVDINDVCGDLHDLENTPIIDAIESSQNTNPLDMLHKDVPEYQESFTWTFYRFRTIKGSVTVRWYGSSNGYYGESVSIRMVDNGR